MIDAQNRDHWRCELSIVMPCLNEAETLQACIRKAEHFLKDHNISGEIVVADNGSTDGSQYIADREGARIISVESRGYGAACAGGIAAARGQFVIMGDADDSYDFAHLAPFVERLRQGYDLVMGNRFKGGIEPGAMPLLHRYLGNPVLSGIGRLFFRSRVGDFQCGLRAFRKSAIVELDLRTTGMEFASEMVVKATLRGLRTTEVPTTLSRDGLSRPPHLRTWRDGWRYLRLLLCHSPRWLFLYPGVCLVLLGLTSGLWFLLRPMTLSATGFHTLALLYAAVAIVVGFQSVSLAILAEVLPTEERLLPMGPRVDRVFRHITVELGLAVGATLILCGSLASIYTLGEWRAASTGPLQYPNLLRVVVPAVVLVGVGLVTILSSFFLGVLGFRRKRKGSNA